MIDELKEIWKYDPFTLYHLRQSWPVLLVMIYLIAVIFVMITHGHVHCPGGADMANHVGNLNPGYIPSSPSGDFAYWTL